MLSKKKWCKDNWFFLNNQLFAPLIFRQNSSAEAVSVSEKQSLLYLFASLFSGNLFHQLEGKIENQPRPPACGDVCVDHHFLTGHIRARQFLLKTRITGGVLPAEQTKASQHHRCGAYGGNTVSAIIILPYQSPQTFMLIEMFCSRHPSGQQKHLHVGEISFTEKGVCDNPDIMCPGDHSFIGDGDRDNRYLRSSQNIYGCKRFNLFKSVG